MVGLRVEAVERRILRALLRRLPPRPRRIHAPKQPRARIRHQRVLGDDLLLRGGLHHLARAHDLGAALVAVALGHGAQLLLDHVHQLLFAGEDGLQLRDALLEVGVFLAQRQNFEVGQPLQPHVQNRLRLRVRQREPLHQRGLGGLGILALSDEGDHLVEVVHRHHQAFEDVGAGERAVQLVAGARGHDVFAVADVVADGAPERELARLAVGDGHEVHAEGDLQIAVFEQVGQHLFRVGVLFQLDHRAHAGAVALVADVVDAAQQLRALFFSSESLRIFSSIAALFT